MFCYLTMGSMEEVTWAMKERPDLLALAFSERPDDEQAPLEASAKAAIREGLLVCFEGVLLEETPEGTVFRPTGLIWTRHLQGATPTPAPGRLYESAAKEVAATAEVGGVSRSRRRRHRSPMRLRPALALIAAVLVLALLAGMFGRHLLYAAPLRSPVSRAAVLSPPQKVASANNHSSSTADTQAAADLSAMKVWASETKELEAQSAALAGTMKSQAQALAQKASSEAARNPKAEAPTAGLKTLMADQKHLTGLLQQLRAFEKQASAKLTSAPTGNSSVRQAKALFQKMQEETRTVASETSSVRTWVSHGKTAIAQFQKVHDAPKGWLGANFRNPPSDWTVQGCEVVYAKPGTAASQIGLLGSEQRIDPVGDVITLLRDTTDGNKTWNISNCAALTQAMAWTRSRDKVVVNYYHRKVIWYELSGKWIPESGSGTLGGTVGPACPAALTGNITSMFTGNRIDLTINLLGPKATQTGLTVMLDTGGVEDYFPNGLLQKLGYVPYEKTTTGGIVPGATGTAYFYHIPGHALQVMDHGHSVALAQGTLTVMGVVGGASQGDYGLGPDILRHGAKLSTSGDRWTLVPPCG